jgi:hypothetical protein
MDYIRSLIHSEVDTSINNATKGINPSGTPKVDQRKAGKGEKMFNRLKAELAGYYQKYELASLGKRTSHAFKELWNVMKEWFKNIYEMVVGLLPDDIAQEVREAGFIAMLIGMFKRLACECRDTFARFYHFVKRMLGAEPPLEVELGDVELTDLKQGIYDDSGSELEEFVPRDGFEHVVELQAGKFDSVKEAWDTVKNSFSKGFEKILKFVTSIATKFFEFKKLPSPKEVVTSLRDYCSVSMMLSNIKEKDIFRTVANWFYHLFTGSHKWEEFQYLEVFRTEYDSILHTCNAHDDDTMVPLTVALDLCARYKKFEQAYSVVISKWPSCINGYRTMRDTLREKVAFARGLAEGSIRRIKPVSVCFFGPTGCGKSSMETYVQKHLFDRILQYLKHLGINESDQVYQRFLQHRDLQGIWNLNCVSEKPDFDENYSYQPFTVLQELYTNKDSAINTEWSAKFFGLIDDQPLCLNRAFGDKGKVYFTSPFIIATGNAKNHYVHLEDPGAYYRRLDLDFSVVRDPSRGSTFQTSSVCKLSGPVSKILLDPGLAPHPLFYDKAYNYSARKGYVVDEVVDMIALIYIYRVIQFFTDSPVDNTGKPHPAPKGLAALNAVYMKNRALNRTVYGTTQVVPPVASSSSSSSDGSSGLGSFTFTSSSVSSSSSEDSSTVELELNDVDPKPKGDKGKQADKPEVPKIVVDPQGGTDNEYLRYARQVHFSTLIYTNPMFALKAVDGMYAEVLYDPDYSSKVWTPKSPCSGIGYLHSLRAWFGRYAKAADDNIDGNPVSASIGQITFACKTFLNTLRIVKQRLIDDIAKAPVNRFDKRLWGHNQLLDSFDCLSPYQVNAIRRYLTWFPASKEGIPKARSHIKELVEQHRIRARKSRRRVTRTHREENAKQSQLRNEANAQAAVTTKRSGRRGRRENGRYRKENNSIQTDIQGKHRKLAYADKKAMQEQQMQPKLYGRDIDDDWEKERRADAVAQQREDADLMNKYARGNDWYMDYEEDEERYRDARSHKFDDEGSRMFDGTVDLHSGIPSLQISRELSKTALAKCQAYWNLPWWSRAPHPFDELDREGQGGDFTIQLYFDKHRAIHQWPGKLMEHMSFMIYPGDVEKIPITATPMQWIVALTYIRYRRESNRPVNTAKLLQWISAGYMNHRLYWKKEVKKKHVYAAPKDLSYGDFAQYARAFWATHWETFAEHFAIPNLPMEATIGVRDFVVLVTAGVVGQFVYKFVTPWIIYLFNMFSGYVQKPKAIVCDLAQDVMDRLNEYTGTTGMLFLQHSGENKHTTPKVPIPRGPSLKDRVEALKVTNQDGQMIALNKAVSRNMYVILSQREARIGFVLFIKGTVAVMNAHVYAACPSEFEMIACTIMSGSKPIVPVIKRACTKMLVKDDMLYIDFGPSMRAHQDLVSYFAPKEEITKFSDPPAAWANAYESNEMMVHVEPITDYAYANNMIETTAVGQWITNRIQYTWIGATPGACGTPICAYINGRARIVGLHRAGLTSQKFGVAGILTLENWLAALKSLPILNLQCGATISMEDSEEGFYDFDHREKVYTSPKITTALGTTQFVRTPFEHSKFLGGSPKIPAALDAEAYRNALVKETAPCNNVYMRPEVLDIVLDKRELIMKKFCPVPMSKLVGCRTLTPHESTYGFSDALNPFDLKTSEGMRLPILGIRKEDLAEPDHPSAIQFHDRIEKKVEKFKETGTFTLQMNADCMKDEPRDIERVRAKKTRNFNITDHEDNTLIKMALGHLVAKLKRHMLLGPAMCGVAPTQSIWSEIFRIFTGKDIVFSDVSGWDYIAGLWIHYVVLPWICMCYGGNPNTFACRFAMWAYMSCSQGIRFNNGKGRRINRGNSTGNWITTFKNTIDNHVLHCVAWTYMAEQIDAFSNDSFFNEFTLILYSDDNISASTMPFWTVKNVALTFKKLFGVTLTSTSKVPFTEETPDERYTIFDADFLSRRFVPCKGIIKAPLSYESLVAQIYYVRSHKGATRNFLMQQLQLNLDNVSRELIEWEPEQAHALAMKIHIFIMENQLPVIMPLLDYSHQKGCALKLSYY